ncbi:MAG: metallophosphoesterase family protein [Bacteroidetes bacterium]|nr:MAG: metallophosphoesterase family protein [Bacteroidota bacterium]
MRKYRQMFQKTIHFFALLILLWLPQSGRAKSDKFRVMWREDPSTTMVIGWNQASGANPILHLDVIDHGQDAEAYAVVKKPDRIVRAKGMVNCFVRMWGLKPNTVYYFVVRDEEGVSQRMSFKTISDNPADRLSIIAGGDSRNNRETRRNANRIVSRLRPDFILFGGDMTAGDTDQEWIEWFDDWQLTHGSDGRIFPVVVARGNHESENRTLIDLFDVKNEDAYYALSFGGNLLRVYTLNSLIPPGGYQKNWLLRDLRAHPDTRWKIAQYHFSTRPHTKEKRPQIEQQIHWSTAFYEYGVRLAIESDAHDVKRTWPIRPCPPGTPGSDEGFIRDDENGTVYVGEGCWGAPLRHNDNPKKWTRSSGSFNQFKWIFVDERQIELRTVVIDESVRCQSVRDEDRFTPPPGLKIWEPAEGAVVRIPQEGRQPLIDLAPPVVENTPETEDVDDLDYEPEAPFSAQATSHNAPATAAMNTRVGNRMQISGFKAIKSGADILIKWETQNEQPRMEFEIQRSIGRDANFKAVCTIQGKGPRSVVNKYSYVDKGYGGLNTGERVNYRLKQIFPNGESAYFDLSNGVKESEDWSKFPLANYSNREQSVSFKYTLKAPGNVAILVIDKNFQVVKRVLFKGEQPGSHDRSISISEIPKGQYLLVIRANKHILNRFRILKE